jgi:hypothetical protein
MDPDRVSVLGEFGGLGLSVAGHIWQDKDSWGYQEYRDNDSLRRAYAGLIAQLRALIVNNGVAAAVYTQTTDVEVEVNGMLTYDRAVIKMGAEQVNAINALVYQPLPTLSALTPTSPAEGVVWGHTMDEPDGAWQTLLNGLGNLFDHTPGCAGADLHRGRIEVVYAQHPTTGRFDLLIDGALVQTVRSRGPLNPAKRIIIAVPAGTHTLRIVPYSRIAIDGFAMAP